MSETSSEPNDWLDGGTGQVIYKDADEKATWRGDPTVHDEVSQLLDRRARQHHVVTSLQALRQALGMTQVAVAAEWGRPQSQVSRLEGDPLRAELNSLVAYVHSLGGHLTVTAELDGETFTYEFK